jgi:hypothetical protein
LSRTNFLGSSSVTNKDSFITMATACPAPCHQTRTMTTTCSTASSVKRLPGGNAIRLFVFDKKARVFLYPTLSVL